MNSDYSKIHFAKKEESSVKFNLESKKFKLESNNEFNKFVFSKHGKNIFLFVPDAGLGPLITKLFTEYPKLARKYSGFVDYDNTVAVGPFTLQNNAALIGGPKYHPININKRGDKTIRENIVEAYTWMHKTMTSHDFNVTFYKTGWLPCKDLPSEYDCRDNNGYIIKTSERQYSISPEILFNLSFLKAIPLYFKPAWYFSHFWENAYFSNKNIRYQLHSRLPAWKTFSHLKNYFIINNDKSKNYFIQYWYNLLIPPFIHGADCSLTERLDYNERHGKKARKKATFCVLQAMGVFIDWLKENNIYNNTMIIIAADHGSYNYESFHFFDKWMRGAITPVLMVKDFNKNSSFRVSHRLMSNSDVPSLICSSFGGCSGIPQDPRIKQYKHDKLFFAITGHGNTLDLEKNKFDIFKVVTIKDNVHNYVKNAEVYSRYFSIG